MKVSKKLLKKIVKNNLKKVKAKTTKQMYLNVPIKTYGKITQLAEEYGISMNDVLTIILNAHLRHASKVVPITKVERKLIEMLQLLLQDFGEGEHPYFKAEMFFYNLVDIDDKTISKFNLEFIKQQIKKFQKMDRNRIRKAYESDIEFEEEVTYEQLKKEHEEKIR